MKPIADPLVETPVALPMTIAEIDAPWLQSALRTTWPQARVTRLDVVDVVHGTCTKVRIAAEAEGVSLPETLMLKGGFEPHSREMDAMLENEIRGYLETIPALGLRSPRCYFAGFNPAQRQGIIVMEDLRASDVRFCDPCRGESPAATESRIVALAQFHARSWQSERFRPGGDWDWMVEVMRQTRAYAEAFLQPQVWESYLALPRGAAAARHFRSSEWMTSALDKMCLLSSGQPHCVLHGDTHLGNLYFSADGTPGFFDSLPSFGPSISEVAYHIVCALDVADRREHERALVARYLTELEGHGIASMSLDEAMANYAAYLARAYFIFVINSSEFQKEAVNTAYTARISSAMLDHDTIGRLAAIR